MSNIIPFPVRENEYVQNYLRKMKEYNKNAQEFEMLLNTTHSLEIMLYRSNRGLVAMQKQLDEIKEIQKHHIKAELNNINNSIHKNADSAKSMLAELKEKIINACKVILQGLKDHGSSALNKTACFLKLQKRLETIANTAVKNNNYCDNAIKRIEQFSENYHKIGLSSEIWGVL